MEMMEIAWWQNVKKYQSSITLGHVKMNIHWYIFFYNSLIIVIFPQKMFYLFFFTLGCENSVLQDLLRFVEKIILCGIFTYISSKSIFFVNSTLRHKLSRLIIHLNFTFKCKNNFQKEIQNIIKMPKNSAYCAGHTLPNHQI